MTLHLVLAAQTDIHELDQLYTTAIDHLNQHTNHAGWKKDVYPVRETAVAGICDNSLYIVRQKDRIIGTIILNHRPEPAYDQANWGIEAVPEELFVVHTFVVHPAFKNQGIGEKMLEASCKLAQKKGIKAIRLDVYTGNSPAIHLYEKCGFTYVDTVDLGLGDQGLDRFRLYEKVLCPS